MLNFDLKEPKNKLDFDIEPKLPIPARSIIETAASTLLTPLAQPIVRKLLPPSPEEVESYEAVGRALNILQQSLFRFAKAPEEGIRPAIKFGIETFEKKQPKITGRELLKTRGIDLDKTPSLTGEFVAAGLDLLADPVLMIPGAIGGVKKLAGMSETDRILKTYYRIKIEPRVSRMVESGRFIGDVDPSFEGFKAALKKEGILGQIQERVGGKVISDIAKESVSLPRGNYFFGGIPAPQFNPEEINIAKNIMEGFAGTFPKETIDKAALAIGAKAASLTPQRIAEYILKQKPAPEAKAPAISFKTTNEALAYGKSITGDEAKINELKAERDRLTKLIEPLKGVKGKEQEGFDLSVKKQLVNEALSEAEKIPTLEEYVRGQNIFKGETGISDFDSHFDNTIVANGMTRREYYEKVKGITGKVVFISPDEYLERATRGQWEAMRPNQRSDWKNYDDFKTYVVEKQRISEDKIKALQDKLKKGERWNIPSLEYDKETGKLRSQEGYHRAILAKRMGIKQIPVMEVNKPLTPEVKASLVSQPMGGGKPIKKEEPSPISKADLTDEVMDMLNKSERDFIIGRILEGKSLQQLSIERDDINLDFTKKEEQFIAEKIEKIKQQIIEEDKELAKIAEKEMSEAYFERKQTLKAYTKGKLKYSLKSQGEYADLKHLNWLFASPDERGFTPDELVITLQQEGFPIENDNELRSLISEYFADEINIKSGKAVAQADKRARLRVQKQLIPKAKKEKPQKVKRQETLVGRGSLLNTRQDTDQSLQREITSEMPFTLLGNKSEVLSRLSEGLKNELRKDITTVYDLFGGAKGYRIGLFNNIPSENYHLNELSDERYNYYKNMQDPAKVETMKSTVKTLRDQLIREIAYAFEIDPNKYSSEALRSALNKWLQRGMLKERAQFARDVIQQFGNKLLMQAVSDGFKSPESSAIYYFLENTSVFGISKEGGKYTWTQGIIRTSQDKSTIRDTMSRITDVDKNMGNELTRDGKIPITQMDAWQAMDEITKAVNAGGLDPDKTVVLVDPQYLNPTAKEGTYAVGTQDSTWEGHKQNLEAHLLPLAKSGVKIIYTNNEDINLNRWLRANKLPYNVEESIGAVANRGGRDEIISFINYKLPKEYTTRGGANLVGLKPGEEYLTEEITGESKRFAEWLKIREELIKTGQERTPSFGKAWDPEQRKALYVAAMNKGLVHKNLKGRSAGPLLGLIRFYKDASYDQLMAYINALSGTPETPARIFKLYGDIDKDREVIEIINKDSQRWIDINNLETQSLDIPRVIEKVTRRRLWEDNILGDNTLQVWMSADSAMFDRLVKENTELIKAKEGIEKNSKESAELMRKFEEGKTLTPKEERVVKYLRAKYESLIAEYNEVMRAIGAKQMPYRKNYMTHIREHNLLNEFFEGRLEDTSKVSDAQLEAIRKGDYTKGYQPFNQFALKRRGPRTKYDAIGNYEIYRNTILKGIYYTPGLRHSRKFIEYALARQPNAYKAIDRLISELKGKKSIADQNLYGQILDSAPVSWFRSHFAKSALLGNINFWVTNLSNFTTSMGELRPKYLSVGMGKFLGTKEWRDFAFKHSVMLKGRTIDPDLDPSTFNKIEDAIGFVTNLIEMNNVGSTYVGAYFKGIEELEYDQIKAMKYADAIARRTQVGYKKYEMNAYMRSKAGAILSQFQNWSFNSMNYLIYDLGLGNLPKNLLKPITKVEGGKVRWGAFWMLLVTSLLVNALYEKMGLRKPYGAGAIIPKVPFFTAGRYEEPGIVRFVKNIGQGFGIGAKKPETRAKAARRAVLTLIPAGTQIERLMRGQIFPNKYSSQKKTSKPFVLKKSGNRLIF